MGKFNTVLLYIGLSIWVALYSLWYLFDCQQLYFIGQAILIFIVAIIFFRIFKSKVTKIFLILAVNQLVDELLMNATTIRISEYITIGLVIMYILVKNDRQN